jgi:hypothetical protein
MELDFLCLKNVSGGNFSTVKDKCCVYIKSHYGVVIGSVLGFCALLTTTIVVSILSKRKYKRYKLREQNWDEMASEIRQRGDSVTFCKAKGKTRLPNGSVLPLLGHEDEWVYTLTYDIQKKGWDGGGKTIFGEEFSQFSKAARRGGLTINLVDQNGEPISE